MEEPGPSVVVRASLADQALPSLAIALGANLPSPAGPPAATLTAVRPQLEPLLQAWWAECRAAIEPAAVAPPLQCHWSPLFATAPVGGPADQPLYCNAVLVVEAVAGLAAEPQAAAAALRLLQGLHALERQYGRQRRERWGPRSLDLDLLWWGELRQSSSTLELPHPRWQQRAFVLAPLLALEQHLGHRLWLPPGASTGPLSAQLAACSAIVGPDPGPVQLPARPGWPE